MLGSDFVTEIKEAVSQKNFSENRSPSAYSISVPGKSLLSGGYLILDESNHGLSVAVSAHTSGYVQTSYYQSKGLRLKVVSPDLQDEWTFYVSEDLQILSSKSYLQNSLIQR